MKLSIFSPCYYQLQVTSAELYSVADENNRAWEYDEDSLSITDEIDDAVYGAVETAVSKMLDGQ